MKNDFITIPDAPNYEVNSEGKVRNKTTGKFLKNVKNSVSLTLSKSKTTTRSISRILKLLFNLSYTNEKWQPVPSLNYKYEVTEGGLLRNAKTKHILKSRNHHGYNIRFNKKIIYVSVNSLLWEVHGIINTCVPTRIPVTLQCGEERYYFSSRQAAARFLVPKIFMSISSILMRFRKRITEIDGWKITYHLPGDDLSQVKTSFIVRKKNR